MINKTKQQVKRQVDDFNLKSLPVYCVIHVVSVAAQQAFLQCIGIKRVSTKQFSHWTLQFSSINV